MSLQIEGSLNPWIAEGEEYQQWLMTVWLAWFDMQYCMFYTGEQDVRT